MATKPSLPQKWEQIKADIMSLVSVEVLVGFPEDTTERKDDREMTNAELAYIHDKGAPEANIPKREFMRPGIESVKGPLADELERLAKAVHTGRRGPAGKSIVEIGYQRVGLIAQKAIRAKINEGIPPPLAERTLQERAARGRKGAKQELANRALGLAPSTQLAKPLIDTAQMRNAVTYVIRSRKKRK
jgi:hypothetical protein